MRTFVNGFLQSKNRRACLGLLLCLVAATAAWAVQPPEESELSDKAFFLPELYLSTSHIPIAEIVGQLPNRAAWEGFAASRGLASVNAYIDPRSGAASNLIDAVPLLPGDGVGNRVTLRQLNQRLGRNVRSVDETIVGEAALSYVLQRQPLLAVEASQLGNARASQVTPELWQVRIPQVYHGIPVRHGHLVVSIKHGNVVLAGTEAWGNVSGLDPLPRLSADDAVAVGFGYIGGQTLRDRLVNRPVLEIVPIAPPEHQVGEGYAGPVGVGYGHRLVWSFSFQREPEHAVWEFLVDAHTSQVLALQDSNHYVAATITGGVYPVTATGICPTPGTCGTMQSGWPMPFADTGLPAPNNFTNSGGVFDYTSGTATTTLSGRYVDIIDSCGAISNSAAGSINLGGTNNQHDCTTGGGSAGNTASSRTAFYETNKLAEQGRGWLPGNTWLQNQLDVNVNLNNTCNAFWNGVTINFYRSGGGCRNTGELAGVFDHEWGHGLDDNDSGGALSNTSEAYADIAAIYRLQTSCVGHGFFQTVNSGCGMTADGTGFNSNEAQQGAAVCCTDCSGVRDADFAKHTPNTPATALGFVCTSCLASSGPCGRQVHCSAAPPRQAAWDLVERDLTSAPFNLDSQSAYIIGNKLFYQGSGNVGAWYSCTCGSSSSGCGATNGYMQWLVADDDNGNINDGTPHMTALFNAFNRHGIACSTPTAQNSGCASGPSVAPTLSATPGANQVALSWNAVSGATRYWVFRTEGHAGCDFGKVLIAEVTGTSYTDNQVANGRQYYYNVVAVGTSSACYTRVSSCVNVTPGGAPTPDFGVSCSPSTLSIQQGNNGTSTCTVTSTNGFASAVSLSCTGQPAGVTCGFSPSSVTPPANGSVNSTLTVTVSGSQPTGTFNFNAQGVSGALTRTAGLTLNVTGTGGGGQTAIFDAGLQAPKCAATGSSCNSGTLVVGRANLGPEPNQPNTIADSCADGTSGTFHSDESVDKVTISTLDGTDLAPGKTARIDVDVWAWSSPSADRLDLYYAANAMSPTWIFITTLTPSVAGPSTLSATYTIPSGATMQAVRAAFRYQGSAAPCASGGFNDRDDLVFTVPGGGGGGPQTAVFDIASQAPKCSLVGSSCDAPTSLIQGRANLGPEPNQPNTIADSCADGTSGTFHSDESVDRVTISTLDGTNMAVGKTVRVDVNVWAWSTPSADRLDIYRSTSATSPTWVLVATLTPAVAGPSTLSTTFTLPAGSTTQAVRAAFRYQGASAPCATGSYNDRDDVIFTIDP